MKLTIIIPVYNAEKYINECLESVLENENNSFEIIIINDGSSDNSVKIIRKFMEKNANIMLINNENHGVSYSRNVGISKAKGDYIMFVDADDKLKCNWFDEINKRVEWNEDIVYFDDNKLSVLKNDVLKYIIGCNEKNICIAGPYSKIFKRKLIVDNTIKFEEKIINGEDMLFNVECLKYAENIKNICFSFYFYRRYVGQTTKKFDVKIFDSDIEFQKKLANKLEKFDISDDEKVNLEEYCLQSAVIMLFDRISYIDKFNDAKKYIFRLYDEPYIKAKNKNLLMRKSDKFKYLLYKMKLDYILYFLFKIFRRIKYKK